MELRRDDLVGLEIGPLRLVEPAGAGAMGEVWRAVHTSGAPVAVKLVTSSAVAARPTFVRDFRNEVRAVAGLDHPNVVRVYDTGRLGAEVERRTHGALSADSPWLAMEWAQQGVLEPCDINDWSQLLDVLGAILGALSHAHARDVVHRDVKPDNVLRFDGGEWKLADFGIARFLDDRGEHDASPGTPLFMAPEQIRGEAHAQGPWTDLYSLGCVAWTLASDLPPFVGASPYEVLQAHLFATPRPLRPRFDVPEDFADWLGWLMAKDHRLRPSFAADALTELEGLGPTVIAGSASSSARSDWQDRTLSLSETAFSDWTDEVVAPVPAVAPPRTPPFPASWQTRQPRKRRDLAATGLGVYALRTVPMVDRDTERGLLWDRLAAVNEGGSEALVLRGASGFGKSRLARWVLERAIETGAAHGLRATHGVISAHQDGVGAPLARALGIAGVSDDAAVRLLAYDERIRDGRDSRVLCQVALHGGGALPTSVRQAAICRFFEAWTIERPVLFWVDDAQWGADALRLVSALLESSARVLCVLTVRQEALSERPDTSDLLASLVDNLRVRSMPIGPLPATEHEELVGQLLGLSGELVGAFASRTHGNPLFAVQLVGDCVDRGLLSSSSDGFRLQQGAHAQLPEDLHALWATRVQRLLVGHELSAHTALHLAALLGQDIDAEEWTRACAAAGVPASEAIVDDLMAANLAEPSDTGWRFAHGMLRETLERDATDIARLHRACAASVHDLGGTSFPIRRAAHLLAAGDLEEALKPIRESIRRHERRGEFEQALKQVDLYDATAERMLLPPSHPVPVGSLATRAGVLRMAGRRAEALAVAHQALESAGEGTDYAVSRLRALDCLGDIALMEGRLEDAGKWLQLARQAAVADGSPERVAASELNIARCLYMQGRYAEAEAVLPTSRWDDESLDSILRVDVERTRATLAMQRLDHKAALDGFLHAAQVSKASGMILGHAFSLLGLSDAHRGLGDYRAALSVLDEASVVMRTFPALRLAQLDLHRSLVLLGMGALREAGLSASSAHEVLSAQERPEALVAAAVLSAVYAAEGRRDEAVAAASEVLALHETVPVMLAEIASCLARCAASLPDSSERDEIRRVASLIATRSKG